MFGSDIILQRRAGKRSYDSAFPYSYQVGRLTKRFKPATAATVRRSFNRYRQRRNVSQRGYLGIENKFYDNHLTPTGIPAVTDATIGLKNPSATLTLNTVAQGDGESQRDGRQIMMKSIHVKGVIRIDERNAATQPIILPVIYIALVWDKQANGAVLASENVFTNPGAVAVLGASPFRNLEYTKRFVVLQSTTIEIPNIPATGGTNDQDTYGVTIPFKFNKKFNIPCNFNNTTANIANIVDNTLNIVAFASDNAFGTEIAYNSRLRFVG